ncbi:MAG: right-handed parallel beta-helix repeat-containing protein, partial [bacterium]
PGVKVLFQPSAGLIVQGRLHAVGSVTDSIWFLPVFPDSGWGGLGFQGEVPPEGEILEGRQDVTGSDLAYVHMMGARSGHPKIDAPLTIQFASPKIQNSSFTDLEGNVGSVRIVLSSAPQFKDCLFQRNRASQGGAIAISTGSRPLFENCQFIDNWAEVQGGAIYVMLADAQFTGCLFLRNSARQLGGALSGIRVGKLTIERCAWIENSAQVRGHNIFLSEQVNVVVTKCIFSQLRDALYLQQAKGSVEARENWWGDLPSRVRLTDLIYDGRVNPQEPVVQVSASLWAPPPDNPYIPQSVQIIQLCKDDLFTDPMPDGVAIGAKLRIKAEAKGLFSDRVEVMPITILTSYRAEGIVVPLWEKEPNSNIFIGTATIGTSQDQSAYRIKGSVNEEIILRHPV